MANDNESATPKQKKSFKEIINSTVTWIKNFWKEPPKGRYLNLKEILCLGGSAFGVSTLVTLVSGVITATQISQIFDIDVIHGPYICLLASILGLIIQPIFGKVLQNTNTKWGKYKPFIIMIAPIFTAFAIAATWQPDFIRAEAFNSSHKVLYAYLICLPTLILWNLFNNTFYMMPGVITPNQQERTDIWSPIGLVIGFSPTVMNVLGNVLRGYFKSQGAEHLAYRYIGFIYGAVGLVLVMLLFKVKERIIVTNENTEKVGLFEGLKMIFKNKPLMIFTLALVLGCSRSIIEADATVLGSLRYADTMDKGITIFGTLTLITGFAVTPNMILLPFMTRKLNNKTIIMIWCGCNTIGYVILACIGIANIPQGWVSAFVITLLRFIALFNALGSLQPLMLSEMSDYQQLKTGKRLEGFIQMFAYTLVLVFTNVALVAVAYLKRSMGYQPAYYYGVIETISDESTPVRVSDELMNAAMNYFDIALIISAVSAALMLIAMAFYPLSKKKHAEIVEQLKAKSIEEGLYMLDKEEGKGFDETAAEETEIDFNDADTVSEIDDTEAQIAEVEVGETADVEANETAEDSANPEDIVE